ncbi:endolytic transglycosylase MltG [Paeniglutamicibacter sp. R2-26]|uniref:endolytic transglycosylase MltG n=1 Tax=Paeniglutamicibacter sp. R2-26 TaxID=3144417 RepID=UPI003EE7CD6F
MTNESSFDSSRHEHEVSPRRAARAARQRAEARGTDPVAPHRESGSAYSASSAVSAEEALETVPAAPTEAELAAEHQRAQAIAAAQRARNESALRARSEAIEAQRAAAERVRETLRANAAGPRRARSESGRSAVSPESVGADAPFNQEHHAGPEARVSREPESGAGSRAGLGHWTAAAPAAPATAPAVEAPAQVAGQSAQHMPETRPWDARNHAAMSFNDILSHQSQTPVRPRQPVHPSPAQVRDHAPAFGHAERLLAVASAPATQVHSIQGFAAHGTEPEHEEPAENVNPGSHDSEVADDTWSHGETPAPVTYEAAYDAHDGHADEGAHPAEYPAHPDDAYHDYPGDEHHYTEHDQSVPGAGRESLFVGGPSAASLAARKRRRRRRNTVMAVVLLGFCAVIFGVVLVLQGVMDKLNPKDFPAPGGAPVSFEVKQGWGPKQIGRELVDDNIVASDKLFLEAIQLVETENREIHPGTYDLRLQMPALDAATILIGDGPEKVGYVAIKQNTRMPAVLEEIATATGLSRESLQKLAEDPAAFGIKGDVPNLEGYLHPGEYRFPIDSDAKSVLQLMVDATEKSLEAEGITDPAEQYRTLKVASILQAEARPDDYATVAGALENRLHADNTETNGLLQVDSTVIYGLDRYTLHFTQEEKQDASNKYNSYVHKGLPPTPIGSPGTSAIKAAAHPKANDYYYWVTVNTNTGETKFAKTYSEHQVNQNEFRAWCADNTDVCK